MYRFLSWMTWCHIVRDNVLCSNDHNVVPAALAGQLVLALLQFCVCVGQSGRIQLIDRCCAYWWTGLMLRGAVTAVRGVSFKPIQALSGVYAGVIIERGFFWWFWGPGMPWKRQQRGAQISQSFLKTCAMILFSDGSMYDHLVLCSVWGSCRRNCSCTSSCGAQAMSSAPSRGARRCQKYDMDNHNN